MLYRNVLELTILILQQFVPVQNNCCFKQRILNNFSAYSAPHAALFSFISTS